MRRKREASPRPPRTSQSVRYGALNRLHLHIAHRLDGLLQGEYLGLLPGPGSESGESRLYRPGDDVRRMDWSVTARTTVPHVRTTIADRELESWLVYDNSASLDFGTTELFKNDLALRAAIAFSYLAGRGGNRVAAAHASAEGARIIPPHNGRKGARAVMHRLERLSPQPHTDLSELLDTARRGTRRRGLAVVISDFLDDGDWFVQLKRLAARHHVICVEVLDPVELALPDVGVVNFTDPETGAAVEVQTGSRRFRAKYAEAARAQRERIAESIRRAHCAHLQLRTDTDWLRTLTTFIAARRHMIARR
ncbi:DUF58 domain-containing protein [Haloglycomyces albus]|uniref:DUF58 domain-containing protein n=1 Tax=Haloglycomyces albus TaxID=526067 RepID=UPI0004A500A0|nr:DUF58 domain-containing protein [Haloglycomyces albus]